MDPFMPSSTTTTPPVPTMEIGQRSVTPTLGSHHRRAHHSNGNSRITSYDDLVRFDPFDINFIDGPPLLLPDIPINPAVALSPEELSYLNSVGSLGRHIRSLSMDSDSLDYIADGGGLYGGGEATDESLGGKDAVVPVKPVVHQATQGVSMGGSTNNVSIKAELSSSMANEVVMMKQAMPPEKLARLAVVDPKRAKRILANRESAARSKERKTRYTMELEKKMQILQEESAEISVKLSKIEKENSDMKAEKKEILCETESLEESAKLREELNEALRDKLRQLKKEYIRKIAYKHPNFRGLVVSQFSSQLALYQVTLLRSWKAQQQQQHLGTPPPPSDSDDSSSDSKN